MKPQITIHKTVTSGRVPRAQLARLGQLVLAGEGCPGVVNLIFIADARMRKLNRQYRHRDKTTDVLSFDLKEERDSLLGEVYISIPQARRNAGRFGTGTTAELLRLFCHGLLHLCGTHHADSKSGARMAEKEHYYLMKLKSGGAR